jgi:hypothetical protein
MAKSFQNPGQIEQVVSSADCRSAAFGCGGSIPSLPTRFHQQRRAERLVVSFSADAREAADPRGRQLTKDGFLQWVRQRPTVVVRDRVRCIVRTTDDHRHRTSRRTEAALALPRRLVRRGDHDRPCLVPYPYPAFASAARSDDLDAVRVRSPKRDRGATACRPLHHRAADRRQRIAVLLDDPRADRRRSRLDDHPSVRSSSLCRRVSLPLPAEQNGQLTSAHMRQCEGRDEFGRSLAGERCTGT